MGDANAPEIDGVAHAAADRFGECLLGGETLGEQARDVWAGLVFRQLAFAQHARRETFAVTCPQRFDAGDFDDVGADSEYHAWAISAFIFLTAASSPMNNDSAMMAWPMFSSTILGIATMGCTLW